ncbi:hypothetical protein M427DRAFT_393924 [Gonapodya prolifera JEL478]|uniref:Uncharacterized protein n=1 Tax=Gonapodya prolifera (strain JEL478) TaxID=1344416 RepID=A0A139A7J7_GONPJ|nr:hypothetical protein M427DRAFT_393924 [Gonapodya prolifera JEL478]|eukprot:KXS12648.1 hypothetical protein M427DRAFT_393924 [Gonapodya prolifera JEL478]
MDPPGVIGNCYTRHTTHDQFGKFMYSNDWYGSEKLVFLVHNAAILPWGLLSSIQFSQTIRKHYINIHRWNGRFLLLSLIPASITGFQLGMTSHAIMSSMRVPLAVITFMYPMYNALMGYLALVAPPPGRKKSASIALHQYYRTYSPAVQVEVDGGREHNLTSGNWTHSHIHTSSLDPRPSQQ